MVDATLGNGGDLIFLAKCIGKTGDLHVGQWVSLAQMSYSTLPVKAVYRDILTAKDDKYLYG